MARTALFRFAPGVVAARRRRDPLRASPRARERARVEVLASRPSFLGSAALIDMVLYSWMGDMLVCYRCGARHRKSAMDEAHPRFDLETAERYRQQQLRQRQAGTPA